MLDIVLSALYLRGATRPADLRRSAWPDVVRSLRRASCSVGDAPEALREAGLWAEALVLESPNLLSWASEQVARGRALTAADAEYPARWLRVLGGSAPPALWRQGEFPALPCVSVVGSRLVPVSVSRFCVEIAEEAVRLGFAVVSGRAEGCDRSASRGARLGRGFLVEILPHGIDLARATGSECLLSVCPPSEPFS
ncbi:MAG TPA: DNA-processing protein DprA, partial [Fimbriimonadaceae bacterium]|nr:DNA-processing protein DprA [Fimbriimonadaceae bacterium]